MYAEPFFKLPFFLVKVIQLLTFFYAAGIGRRFSFFYCSVNIRQIIFYVFCIFSCNFIQNISHRICPTFFFAPPTSAALPEMLQKKEQYTHKENQENKIWPCQKRECPVISASYYEQVCSHADKQPYLCVGNRDHPSYCHVKDKYYENARYKQEHYQVPYNHARE